MFLGPRPPVSDNGIVVSFIRNVANLNIYAMQPRLHRARMHTIRCIKHVKASIRGPEVVGGTRSFHHVHDFRVSILNDTPVPRFALFRAQDCDMSSSNNNKLGIIIFFLFFFFLKIFRRVYFANFANNERMIINFSFSNLD